MSENGLGASVEKMRREGVAEEAVATFSDFYERLVAGERGMLPEAELEPLGDVPDADDLPQPDDSETRHALDRTVVIKLNGGLGTSMGMTQAKSLLEVKDGLTFLDIIARQVIEARNRHDARIPLVLMNSFRTHQDSLRLLKRYPELPGDVPLDFIQGKVPKLRADDLAPVEWPDDPELEWAPPGHGDLYTSLFTSQMLATLLERGYQYAFVSNADNLGAVLDPAIAAWFARERLPFVMEVADRTEADKKGGHIARRRDGGLVLRETAQTLDEDVETFQDVSRHRFFNTNSLWIDLHALDARMRDGGGVLGLPMIVNRKTVDPGDASSTPVIQLESAMGAAIGVFDGAGALRVSRRRFAPVKTTNDLLALRSDAYVLTDDVRVVGNPDRGARDAPLVDLDTRFYKLVDDFSARFPCGAPSLVDCERFAVSGDVVFGRDVVARGSVRVEHDGDGQHRIPDGAVLEG